MHILKMSLPRYAQNGRPCLKDPARDVLVLATPEEQVRQCVVQTLLSTYGYPLNLIETEVTIGRGQASKLRADIVVKTWTQDNDGDVVLVPFIVVECKQPDAALTAETLAQGHRYCKRLGARYLAITNGDHAECYEIDGPIAQRIKDIPAITETKAGSDWAAEVMKSEPYIRPSFEDLVDLAALDREDIVEQCDGLWISTSTPDDLHVPILNFHSLLMTDEPFFEEPFETTTGFTFLGDWGVHYHENTNAGGGRWPARYRSFLIADAQASHHVVRLALMGSAKIENDSHWGNRRGTTYLHLSHNNHPKQAA